MNLINMIRRMFSAPARSEGSENETAQEYRCDYCGASMPFRDFAEHRKTCVSETGFIKNRPKH